MADVNKNLNAMIICREAVRLFASARDGAERCAWDENTVETGVTVSFLPHDLEASLDDFSRRVIQPAVQGLDRVIPGFVTLSGLSSKESSTDAFYAGAQFNGVGLRATLIPLSKDEYRLRLSASVAYVPLPERLLECAA